MHSLKASKTKRPNQKAQRPAVNKLASTFVRQGLRARAGEGNDLRDLAVGPYVRVDNDLRRQIWGSRRKVIRWLKCYYSDDAATDFGSRLILKRLGRFGSFLLVNQDADILDLLPSPERARKLQSHRREFAKFDMYLKKEGKARINCSRKSQEQ